MLLNFDEEENEENEENDVGNLDDVENLDWKIYDKIIVKKRINTKDYPNFR